MRDLPRSDTSRSGTSLDSDYRKIKRFVNHPHNSPPRLHRDVQNTTYSSSSISRIVGNIVSIARHTACRIIRFVLSVESGVVFFFG